MDYFSIFYPSMENAVTPLNIHFPRELIFEIISHLPKFYLLNWRLIDRETHKHITSRVPKITSERQYKKLCKQGHILALIQVPKEEWKKQTASGMVHQPGIIYKERLAWVTRSGCLDAVIYMLNTHRPVHCSVLSMAIRSGNIDTFQYIYNMFGESRFDNYIWLPDAYHSGSKEMISHIQKIFPIEEPSEQNINARNTQILFGALRGGHLELVRGLLEKTSHVEYHHINAMMKGAVMKGNVEMTKMVMSHIHSYVLLKHPTWNDLCMYLTFALPRKSLDMVKYLCAKIVDIHILVPCDKTPHVAPLDMYFLTARYIHRTVTSEDAWDNFMFLLPFVSEDEIIRKKTILQCVKLACDNANVKVLEYWREEAKTYREELLIHIETLLIKWETQRFSRENIAMLTRYRDGIL